VLTIARPIEQLADASTDRVHIVCGCRLRVAFCGAYEETDPDGLDVDGTECADCLVVYRTGRCPNCGCRPYEECRLCEESDRGEAA
jgi:hypothetical protein